MFLSCPVSTVAIVDKNELHIENIANSGHILLASFSSVRGRDGNVLRGNECLLVDK